MKLSELPERARNLINENTLLPHDYLRSMRLLCRRAQQCIEKEELDTPINKTGNDVRSQMIAAIGQMEFTSHADYWRWALDYYGEYFSDEDRRKIEQWALHPPPDSAELDRNSHIISTLNASSSTTWRTVAETLTNIYALIYGEDDEVVKQCKSIFQLT